MYSPWGGGHRSPGPLSRPRCVVGERSASRGSNPPTRHDCPCLGLSLTNWSFLVDVLTTRAGAETQRMAYLIADFYFLTYFLAYFVIFIPDLSLQNLVLPSPLRSQPSSSTSSSPASSWRWSSQSLARLMLHCLLARGTVTHHGPRDIQTNNKCICVIIYLIASRIPPGRFGLQI